LPLGPRSDITNSFAFVSNISAKKINNLKIVGSSKDGHHSPHALVIENGATSSLPQPPLPRNSPPPGNAVLATIARNVSQIGNPCLVLLKLWDLNILPKSFLDYLPDHLTGWIGCE